MLEDVTSSQDIANSKSDYFGLAQKLSYASAFASSWFAPQKATVESCLFVKPSSSNVYHLLKKVD